jgi:cob(I)alamin adenosyltransferase
MAGKINRIYTRTGDKGETSILGGKRLSKGHLKVEAYGAVDELISCMGSARALILDDPGLPREDRRILNELLLKLQNQVFCISSRLAAPPESPHHQDPRLQITREKIRFLEEKIDYFQKPLPTLQGFILSGASQAEASVHLCRTVCRRAERCIVRLLEIETVEASLLQYINRLSDFFFALARHTAWIAGKTEEPWKIG